MTTDEIRELIQLVHETGINELEVQRGENRVRIRSGANVVAQEVLVAAGHGGYGVPSYAPHATPAAAPQPGLPKVNEEDSDVILVKSPIVGTYYDSPSPTAAPFVKTGDVVEPKQVLCIIESMKLMNEIEAESAGTVVAKLVQNGRPVEYGEALFRIRPR